MEEIRHKRMIEKKMHNAMIEIGVFAIFLFFVIVVSMQNKDKNAFQYQRTISNYFQNEDMGGMTFDSINRASDAWTWIQHAFKKTLDCSKW